MLMAMAKPLFHLLFGVKWDPSIVLFQILLLRGIFTLATSSNTRKTIPLQSVPLPFSDAAYLYGVPSQLSASSTIERRIPWTRSSSVRTSTLCSFPLPEWPRLTDLLLRQPPSSNNMTSTSIPASLADVYPLVFIVCKFTKLIVKLC